VRVPAALAPARGYLPAVPVVAPVPVVTVVVVTAVPIFAAVTVVVVVAPLELRTALLRLHVLALLPILVVALGMPLRERRGSREGEGDAESHREAADQVRVHADFLRNDWLGSSRSGGSATPVPSRCRSDT
jgi:hypothetical protein